MIKNKQIHLDRNIAHEPDCENTDEQKACSDLILGIQFQQSPLPSGEVLDGLARHIPDVGERWMQLFERQVRHDHDLAIEALRADRQLNNELMNIQAKSINMEEKRIIIAQVVAGSLLLLGMILFTALVIATLWFFKRDKTAAGTVSLALAGAFGYYFRGVLQAYFPAGRGPS